jgi:hypothetical protein
VHRPGHSGDRTAERRRILFSLEKTGFSSVVEVLRSWRKEVNGEVELLMFASDAMYDLANLQSAPVPAPQDKKSSFLLKNWTGMREQSQPIQVPHAVARSF